jgi:hypothetical protein
MMKAEASNPGNFRFINLELDVYRKDGSQFWTENHFSPIRDKEGNVERILCIGRDISERKLVEKEMLLQRDLAMKLSGTSSMIEALRTCIETASEETGLDCGVVYMVREDGKLNPMCLTGFSPAYLEAVALLNGKSKLNQLIKSKVVYIGKADILERSAKRTQGMHFSLCNSSGA